MCCWNNWTRTMWLMGNVSQLAREKNERTKKEKVKVEDNRWTTSLTKTTSRQKEKKRYFEEKANRKGFPFSLPFTEIFEYVFLYYNFFLGRCRSNRRSEIVERRRVHMRRKDVTFFDNINNSTKRQRLANGKLRKSPSVKGYIAADKATHQSRVWKTSLQKSQKKYSQKTINNILVEKQRWFGGSNWTSLSVSSHADH